MAAGTEIDRLFVKIEGDISGLKASMSKAVGEVDKAEKGIGARLTGLAKRFPVVTTAALGTASAVAAVAVASLKASQVAVKYAADLGDVAAALGLNVERLQELRFAGTQNGIAQEEMDRVLMKLNVSIGDAVRNGGAAIDKFDRLGIKLTDTEGRTRATDEVLGDLADRLSKMEGPAERAAAAGDVLGDKLGPKFQAFLGKGRDALDELREAARRTGAVMDEETIQKASEAQNQLTALSMVTKAQLTMALVELGPVLVSTAEMIAAIAQAAGKTTTAFRALAGANPFGEMDDAIQETRDKIASIEGMARRVSTFEDSPYIWRQLGYESREEALADLERLKAHLADQKKAFLDAAGANGSKPAAAAGGVVDEAGARQARESWEERVEAQREAEEDIADFNQARINREAEQRAQREADDAAYMASWQDRVLAQAEAEEEIAEFNDEQLEEERARSEEYIALWWERVDEQKEAENELTLYQQQQNRMRYDAARTALTNLATLMASTSRKMFEVGKAAAIAQTIIDTYAAAQAAYKAMAGIPVVGPALGVAAAAAAIASGLARVQAIKSTTFGNRSVAIGVGGGVTVGTGDAGTGAGGGAGGGRSTFVYLPPGRNFYDTETIRALLERISEEMGDGSKLEVVS